MQVLASETLLNLISGLKVRSSFRRCVGHCALQLSLILHDAEQKNKTLKELTTALHAAYQQNVNDYDRVRVVSSVLHSNFLLPSVIGSDGSRRVAIGTGATRF